MAEAAVEDGATNRFFCHKCSIEITRVLEDYTCPTCLNGFIEELDSTNTSSDEPSEDHSDDEMDDPVPMDVLHQFAEILFGLGSGNGSRNSQDRNNRQDSNQAEGEANPTLAVGTGRRYRQGTYATHGFRPRDRGNAGRDSIPIETMIQDFIVNLTGVGWGPMGPGGRGNGPVFFLGNPGDYAWGREGLDAIVTQLLNQMDVTGPPPLDKEKIEEIPVTIIEQEQVDSNLQCSVCWDDFKVGESVRKLECEHFYHEPCIIPWLELHATCPICRKSLLTDQEDKSSLNGGSNNSGMPDIAAAIFRAANSRASSTSPSASSSSASSTSTSNTNSSNERRHQSPPSDFPMDFEFD